MQQLLAPAMHSGDLQAPLGGAQGRNDASSKLLGC